MHTPALMQDGHGETDPAREMRDSWRRFARDDAMFYVASNRRDWDRAGFYAQGAELVGSVVGWAENVERGRMLEVGCGAGRLLVHFASHFERVDGVDIAPEMIELARDAGMPENVSLILGSGVDLQPFDKGSFDFAFSMLVFQHIPDREVVAGYLEEIARVLRAGGRAVLQFDTRTESRSRRILLKLPDQLLPRTRRRYIRRYPVAESWLADRLRGSGLEVLDEKAPGTPNHTVLCQAVPA